MTKKVTASILLESKKTKQKNRWWFIISVAVCVLGIGAYFIFSKTSSPEPIKKAQIIAPKKGNLNVSIESDGSIINPNIVDLSFLINGTLEMIYVHEGDRVEAGQKLAELDTRDLEFDLRTAESALQIAYANYTAKTAMLTDTQLRELQNSLSSQQDELDSITRNVDQTLQQSLDSGIVTLDVTLPSLEIVLHAADTVLLVDMLHSDAYQILSTVHDSVGINNAKNIYIESRRKLNELTTQYQSQENIDSEEIILFLKEVRILAQEIQNLIDQIIAVLRTANATSFISQTKIDSVRNDISSANNKVLSEITSLTSAIQKIETAYLNQQDKVISAKNAITKLETQMETAIESVEEKEISKKTSLSILSAQITQAQIKVDKAKYNLELAKLSAPISGEIIQINGNEGEAIKIESTSSDTAFIKILSDSNFTTEVYVEEIDIAQIQKDQKVIITLDAIPDLELEGKVTFISSTATKSSSGVVTYLVRVEITDDQGAQIKEGMTTYVEFLTQEAVDAILVPVEAVTNRGRTSTVTLADGKEREVIVGVSDGTMIEIISGLSIDENILVGGSPLSIEKRPERTLSTEMLEKMKEGGFTDQEIEKAKSGEMTTEMKEKMKALSGGFGAPRVPGMGGGRKR